MAVEEAFNIWLTEKLGSFEIEDEVMGSYISSIITTDEVDSEKRESLRDILLDLVHGVDIDELCSEIMNKWNEYHQKSVPENEKTEQFDLGHKVALIMGKQVQPILKPANRSTEEEQLREAILSRCTFVSSEEEDYDSDGGAATTSQQLHHSVKFYVMYERGLSGSQCAPKRNRGASSQNQNVEAVVQAEKERREKLKSEADKKKASDKVNKEKQKQKQEERREKERKRTQKQERRR